MKVYAVLLGVVLFGASGVIGYHLPFRHTANTPDHIMPAQKPVTPMSHEASSTPQTLPPSQERPVSQPKARKVPPPSSSESISDKKESDIPPPEAVVYADDPAPDRGWEIAVTQYDQLIRVDLADEKLYYYEAGACCLVAPCSSASTAKVLPVGTKSDEPHDHIGVFTIDRKVKDGWSRAYQVPMPHLLHYIEGHGIHAAIESEFKDIGSPASHGCVRLMPDVAKWLFAHVKIGCQVEFRK